MDKIREIDPASMTISVDAGTILRNVQDAAPTVGLLLPLSLGAEGSCRIGGNIGSLIILILRGWMVSAIQS
jgi:FAD/FMN-containing dehydrogenase